MYPSLRRFGFFAPLKCLDLSDAQKEGGKSRNLPDRRAVEGSCQSPPRTYTTHTVQLRPRKRISINHALPRAAPAWSLPFFFFCQGSPAPRSRRVRGMVEPPNVACSARLRSEDSQSKTARAGSLFFFSLAPLLPLPLVSRLYVPRGCMQEADESFKLGRFTRKRAKCQRPAGRHWQLGGG